MNLKKIFSVFLACCLSLSFLIIPVSATPLNTPRNIIRFYSDISNLYNDYSSGGMSKSEFLEKFVSSMARFDINYAADVTCFKDVLKVIEFCGFDVPDFWSDWFYENKMGGGGGPVNRDDSVLDGYGAIAIHLKSDGDKDFVYYGDIGYISEYIEGVSFKFSLSYKERRWYKPDGSISTTYDSSLVSNYFYSDPRYILYGNWVIVDAEEMPDDVVTDLPEKEIPKYDDDSVPEDDIDDFLADLLEELLNKFPDTSTIEGLLRSILSKLDTLDKDDDSALLSQILTAIEALKKEEEKTEEEEEKKDISELLALLQELRDSLIYVDPDDDTLTTVAQILHDSLIYKDKETTATVAEMLHDIQKNQITIKNFEIDESLFNQRFALVQAKLLGKFSFISEVKAFIEYAIDSYANTSSCPSISLTLFGSTHYLDFSAFDEHIDLIRWCVAAFFYLSFAFSIFRKIPGYINGGDNT